MIKMKVTLTDDESHRQRSKVTKNELMFISHRLLHSQTSYLVPRYNTISDIIWHKPVWPWLKVKVTTEGQRSQTWRCLRSLNASCFFFMINVHFSWKWMLNMSTIGLQEGEECAVTQECSDNMICSFNSGDSNSTSCICDKGNILTALSTCRK